MFSYAPRRFTADGRRRTVPVAGDDPQGLTAADEASYDIEMHALSAGWAFARSPRRRETVLFLLRIGLGYAWGDVVTTRLRSPEAVGTAGGVTAGVDCGLGVRLGPQSQLFLVVGPD